MSDAEKTVAEKKKSDADSDVVASEKNIVTGENVKASNFKEIKADKASGETIDINFLLDIPLQITVELGSTKMVLNDLLQLGQGSVLELPKLVGEPLEVFVNNKLVARGEPVMVNEKFGIRLTDIISPLERLERLK